MRSAVISAECWLMLAVLAVGDVALAQPAATYQRGRVGDREEHDLRRPTYQRRPVHAYQAPQVAAGSFQRPYPYHLDYYRQRYGGGYEPYFGNLYGSPQIVGAQPFAYSQYPQTQPTAPLPAGPAATATEASVAAPMIICPHCGEPVQLLWQLPQ